MSKLTIVGYEQEGICAHCGRTLKHCIQVGETSQFVGATCFDKLMTKPREYGGKKYRIGSDQVIRLAKAAQFWTVAQQNRNGLFASNFTFDAA